MDRNREDWLNTAVGSLRPLFQTHEYTVPEKVRVSCGWPSKGALARKNRVIGQCWATDCSKDGANQIFISPCIADSATVLATLTHEVAHAVVGVEKKHRSPFKRCAYAVGLEGPATATHAGEELQGFLRTIVSEIGEYPHSLLDLVALEKKEKQSTRMIKIVCPGCGYTCRTTLKWINVGFPTCGCGQLFTVEEP